MTNPFRPRYFLPGLLNANTPDPKIDPQVSPLAQAGNGPIAGYTNTFSLNLVNFDWITWHNYEWENWIVVDALLNAAIGFLNIKGFWKPNTDYLAGQSVFDPDNVNQLYLCLVNHTSGTDFDVDKPLYWKTVDQAKPPVNSVFGRIGDILAEAADYAAFYADKAATQAHINRTDNPHSTSWANLVGKPTTFPPSAHTHVEADITDLDKYTKAQVDAKDASIRADFAAADTTLLNNINTRLPLAGGMMTGFLQLSAAPTALLHAATKGYVDDQVATRLTQAQADALYLSLVGGTLTGFLTLPGAPTATLHAATKGYVDGLTTVATQAEAEAASDNTKKMTPLRTRDSITRWRNFTSVLFVPSNETERQLLVTDNEYVRCGPANTLVLTLPDATQAVAATNNARKFTITNAGPASIFVRRFGETVNQTPTITPGMAVTFFCTSGANPAGIWDIVVEGNRSVTGSGNMVLRDSPALQGTTTVVALTASGAVTLSGDPTAALHAAPKQYVDAQVATRLTQAAADARYLGLSGGTLTGALTLPGDPAQPLQAATKQYVDDEIAALPPPTGVEFASTAEAIAGTVTDKVMSPALVQARQGVQGLSVAGLTQVTFDQVPADATELAVMIALNYPANARVTFDFAGAPSAVFNWTRQVSAGTYAVPVGGASDTSAEIDTDTTARNITGMIQMVREGGPGTLWRAMGNYRRNSTNFVTFHGTFFMQGEQVALPRLNCNQGGFTGSNAAVRWRV